MYLMEFSMTPLGQGESVSEFVARVVRIVRESGLPSQTHAMGTIIEGELDDLLALLKDCFNELQPDCHRVSCSVKFDYREGATDRLAGKVTSVEEKLGAS